MWYAEIVLSATNIISACIYVGTSPMGLVGLTAKEGDANDYVKDYSSHNYPRPLAPTIWPLFWATTILPLRSNLMLLKSLLLLGKTTSQLGRDQLRCVTVHWLIGLSKAFGDGHDLFVV